MQIKTEYVELPVARKTMRTLLAHPTAPGNYPGILLFSDIFQLSDPMIRTCTRLAGYGFVVAAHEIFHRLEPAGTVLEQTDEGRARGMQNQQATSLAHFDEDCRAVLDYLHQHPMVAAGQIGAGGFCIGGHLAFRAALQPDVKATACFYPTWLHNGQLGQGANADSLPRAVAIRGKLLLLFGSLDPLIPAEGRSAIEAALQQANVQYEMQLFPADHGFVREDRAANTFGNMKRNDSIRGPGYTNIDGAMIKRFRFTERIGGELRIDALNVTNSPNFNNPDGGFGNPTFGQVNSTIGGERLVRFGARVTF